MDTYQELKQRVQDRRIAPGLVRMAVVLVMLAALVREEEQRATCMYGLRALGIGLKQYSKEFTDTYPWRVGATKPENAWLDLGLLFPNYNPALETFLCPGSSDVEWDVQDKKDSHPLDPFESASNKQVISYAYGIDGMRKQAVPWTGHAGPGIRLLADKKAGTTISKDEADIANHGLRGRNALYNDGHVQWKASIQALDPDEEDHQIGDPGADDYKAFWSDPPWYGEGMEQEGADGAEGGENDE
jgi:prepilin-type processing-associated H-X9-DG protein